MSMHLTHPGAPGHEAEATQHGWQCTCGAGNSWEDARPRSRGAGGARRHLTAAARNNPEYVASIAEDVNAIRQAAAEDSPETGETAPEPEPRAYDGTTPAQRLEAARAAEFQSPNNDN